MDNLVINLLDNGVINLKVLNNYDDNNRISIVKNKKVLKSFEVSNLKTVVEYEVDAENVLVINPDPLELKVHSKKYKNDIFATKLDFIFETEKETGLRFDYNEDEIVLGLGQDHMANLDNRNVQRVAWHQCNAYDRANNCTVPFYLSSRGYGFL
ncbi:hypothetical protein [Halothermothrix orenii]|uniref:Glycoside hydrolase family 31 N-terminal domain-containing protein n=1 Tax=Halothermothrix orenii (strain H 168 / OCM 544 / DSM 9562) TaxID=373903 RepID=B8CWN4_HALOH|nr:hypothetical protein [Halothermothrix orenii]ACL69703.1 hypothetical protein Hore_09470 [Halothermothrix orenii H 168]